MQINARLCISMLLMSLGLLAIYSSQSSGVSYNARKALLARAAKKPTRSQVAQEQLAERIAPRLTLEPIRRSQLEQQLNNLGHSETPELFTARAYAYALFAAAVTTVSLLVNVPLGIATVAFVAFSAYRKKNGLLDKELAEKRIAIERECPQMADTICQSLATTRDISTILRSYRRVCGKTLDAEIGRTLNDISTGNVERAIRALDVRVSSPALSQITRGLLAVHRGEEQRQYFDILAGDLRNAQDAQIERELKNRPKKLYPYLGILFACLVAMIAIAIGTDIIQSIQLIV